MKKLLCAVLLSIFVYDPYFAACPYYKTWTPLQLFLDEQVEYEIENY